MTVLRSEWSDLSGAELRARLTQRGCAETVARKLVDGRDDLYVAGLITRYLERGPE